MKHNKLISGYRNAILKCNVGMASESREILYVMHTPLNLALKDQCNAYKWDKYSTKQCLCDDEYQKTTISTTMNPYEWVKQPHILHTWKHLSIYFHKMPSVADIMLVILVW